MSATDVEVALVPMPEGYVFALSCPYDGAPVRHVADGAITPTTAVAACKCTECGHEYVIRVELMVGNGPRAPKGRREPHVYA